MVSKSLTTKKCTCCKRSNTIRSAATVCLFCACLLFLRNVALIAYISSSNINSIEQTLPFSTAVGTKQGSNLSGAKLAKSQQLTSLNNVKSNSSSTRSSNKNNNNNNNDVYSASEVLQERLSYENSQIHFFVAGSLLQRSPHTIVSTYFRVPSKNTEATYRRWMKLFLSLQDNMIIFTEDSMVETLRDFRSHALNRTIIISLKNSVDGLPIRKLGMPKNQEAKKDTGNDPGAFWHHQLEMDPEYMSHQSYKLFFIWLSKSWFTKEAIALNYFQSDLFVYSDIGCFRHPMYKDARLIQYPEHVPRDRLLWMAHHDPQPPTSLVWNEKWLEPNFFFHSGSIAAGYSQTWTSFHQRFAQTLDKFVQNRMFLGEDQCVLQSTCRLYPDLCAYVTHDQVYDNHYFGIRYVLHYQSNYSYWYMPKLDGRRHE